MDHDDLRELFASFGPVMVRRMFGGAGIFADESMIALVIDQIVYLKSDEGMIAELEREGMGPFVYATKDGSRSVRSYWRMPDRLYDDPDELASWARRSLEAARASTAARRPRRGVRRKSRKVRQISS